MDSSTAKIHEPAEDDGSSTSGKRKVVRCLKSNSLTLLTMTGVFAGAALGFILRSANSKWSERDIMYIYFFGDLFLRILKCLILPLIISSLVSAIGSLDLSLSRKIGLRAVCYYMLTTVLAVILGLILVLSIQPGRWGSDDKGGNSTQGNSTAAKTTTADTMLDLVRNMFPPNLVQACLEQYRTVLFPPGGNVAADVDDWSIKSEYASGTNILGLVVFSVALGVAMSSSDAAAKPVLGFFQSLSSMMMILTGWVIWISPIGIFFLVAAKILEMKSFDELLGGLGMYFITVLIGLLVHGCLVLPAIFLLLTRRSPIRYLLNMGQAAATAFGTASSSATLPVAIACLEKNNRIDSRIARFVMPIGATVNMDGTALYEAVAALFIAQLRHIDLTFGHIIAVSITATAASIGAAGIPQAGLVTMVMVLDTLGLPAEDVGLVLAVDWLLDRFRTVINVMGDSLGAGIVAHFSSKELDKLASSESTLDVDSAQRVRL